MAKAKTTKAGKETTQRKPAKDKKLKLSKDQVEKLVGGAKVSDGCGCSWNLTVSCQQRLSFFPVASTEKASGGGSSSK